MDLVAGIDIGGTKTKIGLVNKDGKCISNTYFRTREFEDLDEYLDMVKDTVDQLVAGCEHEVNLLGYGVGAPNASSRTGCIENASNLAWKGRTPLVSKLKDRIALPIRLMNDANAAAMGEMLFGNAKGMEDFILLTLGTGLGSGIVANGQIIEGSGGLAGELGHIGLTAEDGRYTGVGVRGGLEAYVSATGLKRTILHMQSKYTEDSRFRDIAFNDLHGEDITRAAEEGDFIALKAFDYTAEMLGMALANFTAFTQPEAIFLLGGLVNSGKWILDPLGKYFDQYLMEAYRGKVQLKFSGLPPASAAICGAAALVWELDRKKQAI